MLQRRTICSGRARYPSTSSTSSNTGACRSLAHCPPPQPHHRHTPLPGSALAARSRLPDGALFTWSHQTPMQHRQLTPPCAAPEGFDPPASSDGRSASQPAGSVYNTDAFTSFQSVSFVEPLVQTNPSSSSSSNNSNNSNSSMGSDGALPYAAGGRLLPSGPGHASHPSHEAPDHAGPMQHHAGGPSPSPSRPSSSFNSYSQYYRQQNLPTDTPTTRPEEQQEESPSPPSPSTPTSPSPSPSPTPSPSPASSPDPDAEAATALSVAEALSRAQQALDKVESSLDAIDQLPSARPESPLTSALSTLRTVVAVGALTAALLASHAFGLWVQWASAALCGTAIAVYGYRKGSLSVSGAVAAVGVGLATLGCSLRLGATLLAFYFSSSKLTQYKEELKTGLDDQAKKGGQRDWVQVFCNALVPTVLAIIYGVLAGCVDVPLGPLPSLEPWRSKAVTALMGGFLGYYACCCGDTWASELGPLSADTPRLITTLRPVRKGTNGGVTLLGLSASILGGAFIGATFYAAAVVSPTLFIFEQQHMLAIEQWKLIPLGLVAGLLGSIMDSVLGATLQFSGYNSATGRVTSKPGPGVQHISGLPWLSNNAVNAVSATTTAAATALAALKAFGF